MSRITKGLRLPVLLASVLAFGWLWVQIVSWPMKASEVPGTYTQTHSYGIETLILESNGSYREVFRFPSGRSINNSGRWETWMEAGGDVMVRVYDGVIDPFPEDAPPGMGSKPRLTYTFRARESPRGKVLEMTPDSEGQIRLARTP